MRGNLCKNLPTPCEGRDKVHTQTPTFQAHSPCALPRSLINHFKSRESHQIPNSVLLPQSCFVGAFLGGRGGAGRSCYFFQKPEGTTELLFLCKVL